MMVGRVIYEKPKEKSNVPDDAEVVLEVTGLNAGRMVKDVSFQPADAERFWGSPD
jgi:ribose transport system ATP-binding protein